MGLIDMHTHMIPDFDDGARNEEITFQMLKSSYEMGVTDIILTSHYNELFGFVGDVSERMHKMEELAKSVSPDLNVYSGNEIFYSSNIIDLLLKKRILTLANSNYVLIEFTYEISKDDLFFAVNEVLMSGFWPIIAHVERYNCLYSRGCAEELSNLGAYLQVNSESFINAKHKTASFVKKLMKKDLISFIASDCHGVHRRPPNLDKCLKAISLKYGEEKAEELLIKNPEHIINNKKL